MNGHRLVYLDSAATSQKPEQVIGAITSYYSNSNSNVHRGVHKLSVEATEAYERSRRSLATHLNAPPQGVIWTRNTTEGLNLVAHSLGNRLLNPGDNVVTTAVEHHSNLVPWQQLTTRTSSELRIIPVDEDGVLDIEVAERIINQRTRIVTFTHMSNVLGTVTPAKQLCDLARGVGAISVVDGAQSVPHFAVNVAELGCDFLAFSAHKMLGPTGVGVLVGKPELLDNMEPFMFGGDMITAVSYEQATWNELPYKFEAGTPNIAGAIATEAAVDYLNGIGMDAVWQHEQRLTKYALERLAEIKEIRVLGQANPNAASVRGGVISFVHQSIHPHDLGTALDEQGIAIRTGHHCAMPLVRSMGAIAAARISFYIYNDHNDIDAFIDGLHHAQNYFTTGGASARIR